MDPRRVSWVNAEVGMGIPVVVAWVLTAAFLLLTYPCLTRLARLDYARLGTGVRHADVAGLLMTLAMVAMVSPVGGPVPVPGWQALFLLTTGWFLAAAVRNRGAQGLCRHCALHHGLSAAAMLYMVTAMPHADSAQHGVWPNMTETAGVAGLAWPAVAVLAAAYFGADGVRAGVRAVRSLRSAEPRPLPPGFGSRTLCRTVMGLGMAYMLVAGVVSV